MTLGQISSYLLYMMQLLFSFMGIIFSIQDYSKIRGSSKKIIEYMSIIPNVNSMGGTMIKDDKIEGTIEFKNVTFEYPSKKNVNVCKNMSFKVE